MNEFLVLATLLVGTQTVVQEPQGWYIVPLDTQQTAEIHPLDTTGVSAMRAEATVEVLRGVHVASTQTDRPELPVRLVIQYPLGSVAISDKDRQAIEALARAYPAITIEGHSDIQGGASANMSLAAARADAVAELARAASPASAVTVWVGGERYPLCREQTPECHQRNRRVVIKAQ